MLKKYKMISQKINHWPHMNWKLTKKGMSTENCQNKNSGTKRV